jgi:uncharacterized protein (UPF0216 family)
MLSKKKLPKVKKTLQELLSEGHLKTGKTVLDEKAQKAKELEIFAQAALDEARMQKPRKR